LVGVKKPGKKFVTRIKIFFRRKRTNFRQSATRAKPKEEQITKQSVALN